MVAMCKAFLGDPWARVISVVTRFRPRRSGATRRQERSGDCVGGSARTEDWEWPLPSHHTGSAFQCLNVLVPAVLIRTRHFYGDLQITFLDVLQLTRHHKNITDNEFSAMILSSVRQATREL